LETHLRGNLTHIIIQRAGKMVHKDVSLVIINSYTELATLLSFIVKFNKDLTACYQLDNEGRFYRCFTILKTSVDLLEGLLPILEVTGIFIKSVYYNGICLLDIAKTGQHHNVHIAIAWVPFETTDNYSWVFFKFKGWWYTFRTNGSVCRPWKTNV
jgi:hypothetical protein